MKLDFLKVPSDERRLYIEQAAIQRNISPVIMEKDFFVRWLLSILFKSEFAESLVFKGGTSLSKIFGAINRFSEDIDLSLQWKTLCFRKKKPWRFSIVTEKNIPAAKPKSLKNS